MRKSPLRPKPGAKPLGWKSPEQRAESFGLAYGQWLRQQGCCVPDCRRFPVELHHVLPKRGVPLEHGRMLRLYLPEPVPVALLGNDGKLESRRCQIPLCAKGDCSHHEKADLDRDFFYAEILGENPFEVAARFASRGDELGVLGGIGKCAKCGKLRLSGFDLIEVLNRGDHEAWLCEDCAPPGPR